MPELNIEQLVVRTLAAFVTGFLSALFLQVIYEKKFNLKMSLIFSLVMGLIGGITTDIITNMGTVFKVIFTFLASIIFYRLLFKIRWVQCFITFGLYTILDGLGNVVAYLILTAFRVDDVLAKNDIKVLLIAHIIITTTVVLGIIIIRYFKLMSDFPKEYKTRAYLTNIVYIVLTIAIMVGNISYYNSISEYLKGHFNIGVIINTLTVLVFFIFSIISTNTIFKLESKSLELDTQLFYNRTMETLMNNQRRFKHNYNNMINVISGYVEAKDWDEFTTYFKEIYEESRNANEISNMALLKIKSAGILGLLSSKLDIAREKGINMNIVVKGEISELNMRISDLCEVLGIFIDNAVEASESSVKKNVSVYMVRNDDGSINISVENSTSDKPDINKIYVKNFSTKGEGRGLGLWVAKRIINKYKNVLLNTITEDKSFKQEMLIS